MRAIVACDRKFGIGKDGKIPFNSDLAFFRHLTYGCPIIMGRKTWESLPKQPLDGRPNIIVSTRLPVGRFSKEENGEHFYVVRTVKSAEELADELMPTKDAWVIGGAEIYKEAIDTGLIDEIVMTRYGSIHECDTYFPYRNELEKMYPGWKTVGVNNDVEDPYMRTLYRK